MRNIPTPTMTAEAFRKKVDYFEGDIVQIIAGDYAGRLAEIVSISSFTTPKGYSGLTYNLKLSDKTGICATAGKFKLVRHADDNI